MPPPRKCNCDECALCLRRRSLQRYRFRVKHKLITRKPMCMCPRCVYHREYNAKWTSKARGKQKMVT